MPVTTRRVATMAKGQVRKTKEVKKPKKDKVAAKPAAGAATTTAAKK
jgi:hypothetical protein